MAGDEEDPVVIAGDLNFSETTLHQTALHEAGLRSAWDVLRTGRGETWRRPALDSLPGLRLDQVMGSRGVEFRSVRRGTRHGSDHWPLVATFDVAPPE